MKEILTKKEKQNYNKMRDALIRITKYESPEKLRRSSEKDWGLQFEDAMEMAYENMQEEASFAVKGVRAIKLNT